MVTELHGMEGVGNKMNDPMSLLPPGAVLDNKPTTDPVSQLPPGAILDQPPKQPEDTLLQRTEERRNKLSEVINQMRSPSKTITEPLQKFVKGSTDILGIGQAEGFDIIKTGLDWVTNKMASKVAQGGTLSLDERIIGTSSLAASKGTELAEAAIGTPVKLATYWGIGALLGTPAYGAKFLTEHPDIAEKIASVVRKFPLKSANSWSRLIENPTEVLGAKTVEEASKGYKVAGLRTLPESIEQAGMPGSIGSPRLVAKAIDRAQELDAAPQELADGIEAIGRKMKDERLLPTDIKTLDSLKDSFLSRLEKTHPEYIQAHIEYGFAKAAEELSRLIPKSKTAITISALGIARASGQAFKGDVEGTLKTIAETLGAISLTSPGLAFQFIKTAARLGDSARLLSAAKPSNISSGGQLLINKFKNVNTPTQ